MRINAVFYTLPADKAATVASILADAAALEARYATEHFSKLRIHGIRPLTESRLAHTCTPLTA